MIDSLTVKSCTATLLLATCFTLVPAVSFAGQQEALKHYEDAKVAYQQGDFSRAAQLLEMAYAESPDLIYQYNRAKALQAQGSFDEALKVLNLYAGPMSRDPAKRFEDVPAFKTELDQQIADKKANANNGSGNGDNGNGNNNGNTGNGNGSGNGPVVTDPGTVSVAALTGWTLAGVGFASLLTGSLLSTGIFADQDDEGNITDTTRNGRQQVITVITLISGAAAGGAGAFILVRHYGNKNKNASAIRLAPVLAPGHVGASLQFRF